MISNETHIGNYKLDVLISENQHAAVFRVEDAFSSQRLVLKAARSDKGAVRINHEIAVYAHLAKSPAVIEHVHSDAVNGMPYYVMPYCKSRVQDLISKDKPLSLTKAVNVLTELVKALGDIHKRGVVHGDLHPKNIMHDGESYLLIDFANADLLRDHDAFTRHGALWGFHPIDWAATPLYAGKSQLLGLMPPSIESDVYALCSIFCALISGIDHNDLFSQDYMGSLKQMETTSAQQSMQARIKQAHARWLESEVLLNYSLLKSVLHNQLSYFYDQQTKTGYTSPQALLVAITDAILRANGAESNCINSATEDELANANATIEFQHDTRFSEDVYLLKQELEQHLRQNQTIDEQLLDSIAERYKLNNTLSDPLQVLRSLAEEIKQSLLSEPEYNAFTQWSERLLSYKKKYSTHLTKKEEAQFILQGVQEGAGDEQDLRLWIDKHFSKQSSLSNKKIIALVAMVGISCLLYVGIWQHASKDDAKKLEGSRSATISVPISEALSATSDDNARNENKPQVEKLQSQEIGSRPSSLGKADANRFEYTLVDASTQTTHTIVLNRVSVMHSAMDSVNSGQESGQTSLQSSPLQSLYVMSEEVSQGLWQACVNAGKCRQFKSISTSGERRALLEPNRPVVNVSWYDIQEDFIPFMNENFDTQFHLPSMAEWLGYAYSSSGQMLLPQQMHCKGCIHPFGQYADTTIPVNLLQTGAFGLRHVFGNAQEWLQDCWQDVKLKRERCDQAPAMGGSWMDDKQTIEQAPLSRLLKTARSTTTGFRLVKRDIAD